MADFTTSIEIEAPPETVFDYLTTDAGMTAWMGEHAELDPRPGGQFAVDSEGAPTVTQESTHQIVRQDVLIFDRLSYAPPAA